VGVAALAEAAGLRGLFLDLLEILLLPWGDYATDDVLLFFFVNLFQEASEGLAVLDVVSAKGRRLGGTRD
jgi:hypothetical protein